MRLCFYDKCTNFGDALNPMVFKTLLPDFFDDDPSVDFLGIGSIVGLSFPPDTGRRIVFSSGFAYGSLPRDLSRTDFVCVRGPLTAQALGLDPKVAIADGAVLLKHFNLAQRPKEHEFSFIPHWESAFQYDWAKLCAEVGIHYISPMDEFDKVADQLLKSKAVITEAMHGAIVADVLRVPWIPVKAYRQISAFKWNDWAQALEVPYEPLTLPALYDGVTLRKKLSKTAVRRLLMLQPGMLAFRAYAAYQSAALLPKAVKALEAAKRARPNLSEDAVLDRKYAQLREKLDEVRARYG